MQDRKVTVVAIEALGNLGDREAVPALTKILAGSGDKVARFAAAGALGKIGDPAAADALRQAARSDRDSSVWSSANKALRKLEKQAAVAVASDQAQDESVKQLAAEGRERRAFNLPFILVGLAAVGVVSFWVDPDSLGTTLPVLVVAALVVIGINLFQGWQKNR